MVCYLIQSSTLELCLHSNSKVKKQKQAETGAQDAICFDCQSSYAELPHFNKNVTWIQFY